MDRAKPKNFVQPAPSAVQPKMSVQDTITREIQHDKERKEVKGAAAFLDKFFRLFADYSFSTARSHKRATVAASTRAPQEIAEGVTAFYAQRPRPWRPAGNRPATIHPIRFRYRKASSVE